MLTRKHGHIICGVVPMLYPCPIGVLPIFQKLLMLSCCTCTSVYVHAS